MRCIALLLVLLASAASGQNPPRILLYRDADDGESSLHGFGDAVIHAAENLWPGCSPRAYCGWYGQPGFNAALAGGDWDLVILECWRAPTNGIDWLQVRDVYLADEAEVFVYNWHWFGSSSGQFECIQAMGVEDLLVSAYNNEMDTWVPGHPIAEGIPDWTQHGLYPSGGGSIIRQIYLDQGDLLAVTGWTEGSWDWAGICVAADGESVVSGYCPAYSVHAVEIWENILEFMADSRGLAQTTWGGIKSSGL